MAEHSPTAKVELIRRYAELSVTKNVLNQISNFLAIEFTTPDAMATQCQALAPALDELFDRAVRQSERLYAHRWAELMRLLGEGLELK